MGAPPGRVCVVPAPPPAMATLPSPSSPGTFPGMRRVHRRGEPEAGLHIKTENGEGAPHQTIPPGSLSSPPLRAVLTLEVLYPGPGDCRQAAASVAKGGEASAVPRYKTGLDFVGCPHVSLCWRPGWAAGNLTMGGILGGCLATIQECSGER